MNQNSPARAKNFAAPRLYDAATDGFIVGRSEVIRRLVKDAGAILTFSTRSAPTEVHPTPEANALFLAASSGDQRSRWAIFAVVRDMWRSQVSAA